MRHLRRLVCIVRGHDWGDEYGDFDDHDLFVCVRCPHVEKRLKARR